MSLRDLAARSGLSPTLLSQVERGVREPSLKTLRALGAVFGSASATLFSEPGPIVVHHSRPGQRSKLQTPSGMVQYERLTPNNGQLEMLRGVLEPGETSSAEPWAHTAVECAYVIEGAITIEVDGQGTLVTAGESLTFDASHPHRYVNNGRTTGVYLTVSTPPTP